MLCKTATHDSTYNELRHQDNCNVIVIMRGDNAGDYKPSYVLDENSIRTSGSWKSRHEDEVDENYNLKDDPCETLSNPKFIQLSRNLNSTRQETLVSDFHTRTFHVSNAYFKPYGYDVIWPNFVDDSLKNSIDSPKIRSFSPIVKKTAKKSLRDWTKERVYII